MKMDFSDYLPPQYIHLDLSEKEEVINLQSQGSCNSQVSKRIQNKTYPERGTCTLYVVHVPYTWYMYHIYVVHVTITVTITATYNLCKIQIFLHRTRSQSFPST